MELGVTRRLVPTFTQARRAVTPWHGLAETRVRRVPLHMARNLGWSRSTTVSRTRVKTPGATVATGSSNRG